MNLLRKILGCFLGMAWLSILHASPMQNNKSLVVTQKPGMTITIKQAPIPFSTNIPASTQTKTTETSEREKVLYLTFDDGPVDGTENLLNLLEEENIEATMFCVGRHAKKRPELFIRERRMENLLVANHTYAHANGHYSRFYRNLWAVMSDVEHAQIILGGRKYLRLAGRNVWRLPEVYRNDRAIPLRRRQVEIPKYEQLNREGFYIYGWDVEWRFDHGTGRPLDSARNLADRISSIHRHDRTAQRNKVVLLAHDFMFRDRQSVEELRRFVRIMKNRGWHFRKIDHYSASKPEHLHIAKYYKKNARPILATTNGSEPRISNTSVGTDKTSLSLQAQLNEAILHYDNVRVTALVRRGAYINRIDEYGRLAINTAVEANSIQLVKQLLGMGANIHIKDAKGHSAISAAKVYKRREIEKYLVAYSMRVKDSRIIAANDHPNPLKLLNHQDTWE